MRALTIFCLTTFALQLTKAQTAVEENGKWYRIVYDDDGGMTKTEITSPLLQVQNSLPPPGNKYVNRQVDYVDDAPPSLPLKYKSVIKQGAMDLPPITQAKGMTEDKETLLKLLGSGSGSTEAQQAVEARKRDRPVDFPISSWKRTKPARKPADYDDELAVRQNTQEQFKKIRYFSDAELTSPLAPAPVQKIDLFSSIQSKRKPTKSKLSESDLEDKVIDDEVNLLRDTKDYFRKFNDAKTNSELRPMPKIAIDPVPKRVAIEHPYIEQTFKDNEPDSNPNDQESSAKKSNDQLQPAPSWARLSRPPPSQVQKRKLARVSMTKEYISPEDVASTTDDPQNAQQSRLQQPQIQPIQQYPVEEPPQPPPTQQFRAKLPQKPVQQYREEQPQALSENQKRLLQQPQIWPVQQYRQEQPESKPAKVNLLPQLKIQQYREEPQTWPFKLNRLQQPQIQSVQQYREEQPESEPVKRNRLQQPQIQPVQQYREEQLDSEPVKLNRLQQPQIQPVKQYREEQPQIQPVKQYREEQPQIQPVKQYREEQSQALSEKLNRLQQPQIWPVQQYREEPPQPSPVKQDRLRQPQIQPVQQYREEETQAQPAKLNRLQQPQIQPVPQYREEEPQAPPAKLNRPQQPQIQPVKQDREEQPESEPDQQYPKLQNKMFWYKPQQVNPYENILREESPSEFVARQIQVDAPRPGSRADNEKSIQIDVRAERPKVANPETLDITVSKLPTKIVGPTTNTLDQFSNGTRKVVKSNVGIKSPGWKNDYLIDRDEFLLDGHHIILDTYVKKDLSNVKPEFQDQLNTFPVPNENPKTGGRSAQSQTSGGFGFFNAKFTKQPVEQTEDVERNPPIILN